jgi:hypothetical protein
MLKISLLMLLSVFLFTAVSAQNQTEIVELKSAGCEIDESNFSVVENASREIRSGNGFLIAVARLGDGDKARNLNQQRLNAAKQWLVGKAHFPANKLILAEGEKISVNGRVEFYIGGVLTHIVFPKPNVGLCWECCNPQPEDFAPRRKSRRKKS